MVMKEKRKKKRRRRRRRMMTVTTRNLIAGVEWLGPKEWEKMTPLLSPQIPNRGAVL